MGKASKNKLKAGAMKNMGPIIGPMEHQKPLQKKEKIQKSQKKKDEVHHIDKATSALYFSYNTQLGPPYHVLIDTNFVHFSLARKIDLFRGMMQCLYAECKIYITQCVTAEFEKLGRKSRIALKITKDPRIKKLTCMHKGTYADDCLVDRVTQHKCYIVATCDKDLRCRIRKIPGVPIMYVKSRKYTIERLPEATLGGASRR